MGWNELEVRPGSKLIHDLPARPYVYFAHSYYVPENPRASATCTYELTYTAVLESGQRLRSPIPPRKIRPRRPENRKQFPGARMNLGLLCASSAFSATLR